MSIQEVVRKDLQVETISKKVRLPKVKVEMVRKAYLDYISASIKGKKYARVFGIVEVYKDKERSKTSFETLAYQAVEITKQLEGVSSEEAKRILFEFRNMIREDVNRGVAHSFKGLMRVIPGVRVEKSSVYLNKGIRFQILKGAW